MNQLYVSFRYNARTYRIPFERNSTVGDLLTKACETIKQPMDQIHLDFMSADIGTLTMSDKERKLVDCHVKDGSHGVISISKLDSLLVKTIDRGKVAILESLNILS